MFVYILTNEQNSVLYIGVTNNIKRRLAEHKSEAISGFTKQYKTKKLVYLKEYSSPIEAIKREKQLKGWTRIKKQQLISKENPNWTDMSEQYQFK